MYHEAFHQNSVRVEEDTLTLKESLLQTRLNDLLVEIDALKKAVAKHSEKYDLISNKIYSLPSNEWILTEPIDVILKISISETIAIIPDLELYSEGRNEIEAVSEIKLEVLDLIEDIFELDDDELGESPKAWKASLKRLVKKCQ